MPRLATTENPKPAESFRKRQAENENSRAAQCEPNKRGADAQMCHSIETCLWFSRKLWPMTE